MPNTTVSVNNVNKPAPKWFRRLKKALGILTVAANVMISSWGFQDVVLTTKLQLWCTVGIGAILEALEALLANGDDYVSNAEVDKNKISTI